MKRSRFAWGTMLQVLVGCVALGAFPGGGTLAQCPPSIGGPPAGMVETRLNIAGRVLNAVDNMDLPSVTVRLTGRSQSRENQVAVTDPEGRFLFSCLASGQYLLEASREGFQTTRAQFTAPDPDAVIRMLPLTTLAARPGGSILSARQARIPEKARQLFDRGVEELYKNKDPEASLDYFTDAIQVHPDFDEAYIQMGIAYHRLSQPEEAEETFRKAIEIYPKNGRAHLFLAELFSVQGKTEEGVAELRKALEIEETLWQAHLDLAQILTKQGKTEEAFAHASRAHELNQEFPSVHLAYYNACVNMKSNAAALAELDEIVKLYPDSEETKKLIAIRPKLASEASEKKP